MQVFKDVRAIGRSIAELRSTDAVEEEKATFELAASAYRFSRDTKASVDDKLSFSATLMRAGEVQAATRLIVELEDDVREEEVALVEVISEVQTARSVRREKITRLRLARMLASSMVGACIMGFSAMGIGVAGVFADHTAAPKPARVSVSSNVDRSGPAGGGESAVKHVRIGGTLVALNKVQLSVLRDLQKGKVDPESLEEFLASLPSEVVDSVRMMFLSLTESADEAVVEAGESVPGASTSKGSDAATKPVKETKRDRPDAATENPPPPAQNTDDTVSGGGTLNDTKGLPF
ncbi:MAG: hypothetical protein ABI571_07645 [Actinomycetota bacterium]